MEEERAFLAQNAAQAIKEDLPSRLKGSVLEEILETHDPEELRKLVEGKRAFIAPSTMQPGGMFSLSHALNGVPDAACPMIVASIVLVLCSICFDGFDLLPYFQQAAFVSMFVPDAETFAKMRDIAELFEVGALGLAVATGGLHHLCVAHDEGNDKRKRNQLLLYAGWRAISYPFKFIVPRAIGCLDTSKSGAENARALKERLATLGLISASGAAVKVTLMCVDGAGAKVLSMLLDIGLIFVVICDCHRINKEAEKSFEVGFGKAK